MDYVLTLSYFGSTVLWMRMRNLDYFSSVHQDIQVALRDEIKSACDYRPFEKCDYSSRIANEICCKKLEYVMSQLDQMKETIDEYHNAV